MSDARLIITEGLAAYAARPFTLGLQGRLEQVEADGARTEPSPARLFMLVFSVLGPAALARSLVSTEGPILGDHPLLVVAFAVLLFFAEFRPITSLRTGIGVTASFTFGFALLLVAPSIVGIALMGAATSAADAVDRRPLSKAIFNFGQLTFSMFLAVAAGSAVDDLLLVADGGAATVRWLAAVVVTCAVGYGVNALIISTTVAISQGVPMVEVVRQGVLPSLGVDGLLLSLTPIFAVVGVNSLLLLPLLLFTMWSIFVSARLAVVNQNDALHDQLTGLPNRRLFESQAAMMLETAKTSELSAAVIQLDLNGFKEINDTFGHHAGDVVLQATADRLSSAMRSDELVARMGGDEFAFVIRSPGHTEQVISAARRWSRTIGAPIDIGDGSVVVGGSFGVAFYPDDGHDLETLLGHADRAMYQAKAAGGGVVTFGSVDQESSVTAVRSDLLSAIRDRELVLHFQPVVDMVSARIESVEALLRWQHPTQGLLLPAAFIETAIRSGVGSELTAEVVRLAVEQIERWESEGRSLRVFLNVAAGDLQDDALATCIEAQLASRHLGSSCLGVEISEAAIMADPDAALDVLHRVQKLGVLVSIDGFGTGVSSLALLCELAPDCVKLDRSMLQNREQQSTRTIARAAVELCRRLELRTVAIGVESSDDLVFVGALSVDEVQGHLLARPQSPGRLSSLLDRDFAPMLDGHASRSNSGRGT